MTTRDREQADARREKRITKNQFTGKEGYWITTRQGKRIFVSAEQAREREGKGATNLALGALKTVGLGLTAAIGLHGTYFALNSARLSYFYKDVMPLKRGMKIMWNNKRAVADQLTTPFTASRKSGMGVIPLSVNPIIAPEGIGKEMMLFNYGLVSKRGKSLGTVAYGIDMKEKYIYPVIYFKNQKGQHPQALKGLFQDMYRRSQKLGLKELRMNSVEDGGYAWARVGFEFRSPADREIIKRSVKNWLDNPTMTVSPVEAKGAKAKDILKGTDKGTAKGTAKAPYKSAKQTLKEALESLGPYGHREGLPNAPGKQKLDLTPGERAEMESLLANCRSAKDFAELTYKHKKYGKIRLGKEWMTGTHWNGSVDISTDNPGHRLMKAWLF